MKFRKLSLQTVLLFNAILFANCAFDKSEYFFMELLASLLMCICFVLQLEIKE